MTKMARWQTRVVAAIVAVVAAGAGTAATIKDSVDRSVEISGQVAHVMPAGAPAQVLLHALAPGKLVGLVEAFAPEHVIYVDPTIAGLPQIPVLTRTAAPGDVDAVAALEPSLSVDYGSVSARYVAADEKIGQELKIPALLFDGDLSETGGVVTTLGHVLGVDARAAAIATLVTDTLRTVKPVSTLADTDRVPVYLARGTDGLLAARAQTSFDEPIRLAGGRNVVQGGGPTFKRMSVEDVVALKPAVVIVSDQEALSSPLHAALPKGTKFVLDAGEPYKVLMGPPSLNRLAGLVALAAILHPAEVKVDPDAVTRIETTLFPIPPGLSMPAPLQVRD